MSQRSVVWLQFDAIKRLLFCDEWGVSLHAVLVTCYVDLIVGAALNKCVAKFTFLFTLLN